MTSGIKSLGSRWGSICNSNVLIVKHDNGLNFKGSFQLDNILES